MERDNGKTSQQQDNHLPEGKFTFDRDVTACFDDMLERSIPDYETMRSLTTEMASRFITPYSTVLDIGVSLGQAIAPLVKRHSSAASTFHGIDCSPPMLAECRRRFETEIAHGLVKIDFCDLRKKYPYNEKRLDVVLSILTIQFTPIEYRPFILKNIYDSLTDGGAFLIVEKVLGENALIDSLLVDVYYNLKDRQGYSREQIERKKEALEGVLVPIPAKMNEGFLAAAGFRTVDCYWRWGNFAGWIAIK